MSRGYRYHELIQSIRTEEIRQRALALSNPTATPFSGLSQVVKPEIPKPSSPLVGGVIWDLGVAMMRAQANANEDVAEGRIHVNTRPQRHE